MPSSQKQEVLIAEPSKNDSPAKKDDRLQKSKIEEEQQLSEEEKALRLKLTLALQKLQENYNSISEEAQDAVKIALETIRWCLLDATALMASVPLPLKFLRPHFADLQNLFLSIESPGNKSMLADILSMLATTLPAKTRSRFHISAVKKRIDAENEEEEKKKIKEGKETEEERKAREERDAKAAKRKLAIMGGVQKFRYPTLALKYRLMGSGHTDLEKWGHEYIRNLQIEAVTEFLDRQQEENVKEEIEEDDSGLPPLTGSPEEILPLLDTIVSFLISQSSEFEAVDLLGEMDHLHRLPEFFKKGADLSHIVPYVLDMAKFVGSFEEQLRLQSVVLELLLRECQYVKAVRLQLAMQATDEEIAATLLLATEIPEEQRTAAFAPLPILRQCAFILAQQGRFIRWKEFMPEEMLQQAQALQTINWNEEISVTYLAVAKEIEVLEPKSPDEVFKTHLESGTRPGRGIDSARMNLASTYVNAFVNAGYCTDKLMLIPDSNWLYKNKEHGMMAASASVGALMMWSIDEGLTQIDRYQWSTDPYIKGGAFAAFGLLSQSLLSECDASYALLMDPLDSTSGFERLGAVLGMAFAYCNTQREDISASLLPLVLDLETPGGLEVSAMSAVAIGMIFVGSGDGTVAEGVMQTILERDAMGQLDEPIGMYLAVGLGLLFLGKRDACMPTYQVLQTLKSKPFGPFARVFLETCAFAGTGDVLKVQKFLDVVSDGVVAVDQEEEMKEGREKMECEKEGEGAAAPSAESKPTYPDMAELDRQMAVLALPLIALPDEVGAEMLMRLVDSLLQFGDAHVRRAIPLALALKNLSNPQPLIVDLLSKLSHDPDADVALHAILALGLVGAGSNNARIAQMLRQLASYYSKEAHATFTVRISQGLLHLGKGLLTISPLHSDNFLMRTATLAHAIVVVFSGLIMQHTFLKSHGHYLLMHAIAAARPRMVVTLDANTMEKKEVLVRVGQGVNTVGVAGKPRAITGFQTHTTPVLVSQNERVEIDALSPYVSLSPVIEGGVLVVNSEKEADQSLSCPS